LNCKPSGFNFYFVGGYSYVHYSPPSESTATKDSIPILSVSDTMTIDLSGGTFGHYVWWDLDPSFMAKYHAFIWDLNLTKKIFPPGEDLI